MVLGRFALAPAPEVVTGGDRMLLQAQRQLEAAQGIPVRWIVAEKKFADYLRKLFSRSDLEGIEVIHISPRQ